MSPFDSQEYATSFFEPYAVSLTEAIERGFAECEATIELYKNQVRNSYSPFGAAYKTNLLHLCINNCLIDFATGKEDISVVEHPSGVELLFNNCVCLKVNKVNDNLSLCTNNGTAKEDAYRNPSMLGLQFGYAETAPIYLTYRTRKDGTLKDIKLMKYDNNERQWHVGLDGSNPDTVQHLNFNPVTPVIAPSEQPLITIKQKSAS